MTNKKLKNTTKFALSALLSFGLMATSLVTPTLAAPGDLDVSFGNNGVSIVDFATSDDTSKGIAIQSDGKIVTVGTAYTSNYDFAIVRHNPDGSLDATFGTNGRVLVDVQSLSVEIGNDVLVQSDGKIVVAGSATFSGAPLFTFHPKMVLLRILTDGTLDSGFGNNGVVISDFGSGVKSEATSLAIQSNGKYIVGGWTISQGTYASVARFNIDGSLDTSFGANGIVSIPSVDYLNDPTPSLITDLAVQPDDKIVSTGWIEFYNGEIYVVRLNQDGTLDTTFSGDGKVITEFTSGNVERGTSITVQQSGEIVVGGEVSLSTGIGNFALVRYLSNGTLDASFGNGGRILTPFGNKNSRVEDISLTASGKIIAAGYVEGSASGDFGDFAIAKYLSNGTLDTAFGNNGILTTSLSTFDDRIFAIELDQDENIMATGISYDPGVTYTNFALAKFINSENQSPAANAGVDQTALEGQSVTFDGSNSSDPDGPSDIVSFDWDFGDGATASGQFANHTYVNDGVYNVSLTVTDSAGEPDTDTAIITVNNAAPVVFNISAVDPVLPNTQIDISTSFTDAGVLDVHTATIDWGDGNTTAGTVSETFGSGTVTGSHSYSSSGDYLVTLTVYDELIGTPQTVNIHIQTPSEAIDDLIDIVMDLNAQNGIINSLDAKLDAAQNALDDMNANNDQAALNSLQSFINAVEAQRGNQITNEEADALIAAANAIINSIN